MAQRYGGKFSPSDVPPAGKARPDAGNQPTPRSPWQGKRRTRAGGRVNALFIAPAPLVLFAFGKEPVGLALNLCAFGLLMGAAWMTREGLLAEEAYMARKVAKRPSIPRKIFGAVLTGAGLALAGAGSGDLVAPVIFALLGAGLHVLAFGLDPLSDKGTEGMDQFQADRVARAVDEAEAHLAGMKDAILRAEDRALTQRVERFQDAARVMFRTVEEDPRDLTRARRHLGVYLLGARDATVKFADLYARSRDTGARADYLALLDDLEKGFDQVTTKMLSDDRSDLDVEIEVLRDRLAREGIHADDAT